MDGMILTRTFIVQCKIDLIPWKKLKKSVSVSLNPKRKQEQYGSLPTEQKKLYPGLIPGYFFFHEDKKNRRFYTRPVFLYSIMCSYIIQLSSTLLG